MTLGLIIAAPASGSGKTVVTLALLRSWRDKGLAVASVKAGPDYIDPAFHTAASGRACLNLDTWAMRPETLGALCARAGAGADLVLGEGVMGLFDGAPDGSGSTADLALITGWPVVLVVDAQGMAASAAALVHGFASYRPEVPLSAVIFNRVGGERHGRLLAEACAPLGLAVLGALPRAPELELPDRHLGLVQAGEHPELEAFLDRAAALVGRHLDTERLVALARPCRLAPEAFAPVLPPLGQRIAVARDAAFAFAYPAALDGWRAAGAELLAFSALAGDAPDASADAVYLPGGYPELHAGTIAGNTAFLDGLRAAAEAGKPVYGECGGYMVLGDGLVDADGTRHAMAGLLPLETSFAERRLQLGYRQAVLCGDGPLGAGGTAFRGHEFHYATVVEEGDAEPLFACRDAGGSDIGPAGRRRGAVMGSFIHLVDAV
ncbi:MAG: cobyrinate a,c-diamide synthase [Proteobacteria bacterium]|nr:cobyrinate a,c-diamide synthase [Pseudomonadota bacterium]